MFYQLALRLREIFEAEMIPDGKLEGMGSINIGEYRVLSDSSYPCLLIRPGAGGITISGSRNRKEISVDVNLMLASIYSNQDASLEEISDLVFKYPEKTGIACVLDALYGVEIGEGAGLLRFAVKSATPWAIVPEKETETRALWLAESTITLQTMITL